MPSALDFEISRVKRTQRVHRMQRSLSSTIRFDSSSCLVDWTLASSEIDRPPLYSKW